MNAIALRSAFKSEYIFSTILSVSISQVIACSLRTEENSFEATNQNFDESFKGSLMRHGIYNNCGFTNVNFEGTIGNNSIFKNSIIIQEVII